jgi:hypothetical protein
MLVLELDRNPLLAANLQPHPFPTGIMMAKMHPYLDQMVAAVTKPLL